MGKLTEEQLQAKIDALPREHSPIPYSVSITDKKGNYLATRFVRASSPQRARLVGFKVNYFLFGERKSFSATASPACPRDRESQ